MPLVYNSIVVSYSGSVNRSITVTLYPRIFRTKKCVYNIRGIVAKTMEIRYGILDYHIVRSSVEVGYASTIRNSVKVPYEFEQQVLKSVSITYGGGVSVSSSISVDYAIPGYTMVRQSNRVNVRFTDQTLIQPSVLIRVSK